MFTESLSEWIRSTVKLAIFNQALKNGREYMKGKWWRQGSVEEDQVFVESTDIITNTVSDGDQVSKIELHTGKNVRDQITVEELEAMQEESRFRGFFRRS